MARHRWTWVQRGAKLLAVNLGVLLAAAAVIELAFGTWLSSDPLDRLNIQRGIDIRVDASSLYPGGGIVVYRRNRWGFRGGDIDPAAVDILTVGGSTTNQLYLPEDKTWQESMARRLRELGSPATVVNAGLDGQSTVGHLFSFEAWFPNVPGLKPKIALAYVGINDALIDWSSTDDLRYSSWQKWFRANSALFRLGRTVEGAIQARVDRLTHHAVDFAEAGWTDRPNFPDNRSARPHSDAAAYAERLRALTGLIRVLGAEPVFVTQARGDYRLVEGKGMGLAAESGMNGIDHHRLLAEFNAAALRVCAEERLRCLDLAGSLAFADGDFYDALHNTPQGAEKVGLWLAKALVETPSPARTAESAAPR